MGEVVMNETVKAALLAERLDALSEVRNSANGVSLYRERLADKERWRERELARLADIEAFLRDNGVDLAAVDAEALPAPANPWAFTNGGPLVHRDDPTAGLAKALAEG
jgi:hypothetical protein